MSLVADVAPQKSRLGVLLDHFAAVDDPRDVRRIAHPLAEVLLLVVCGTMADCDDYDAIAAWGCAHLGFLRRHLPYEHGIPGGRWLTILMNRINPALFSAAFTAWVRATWPDRPDLVAIDGKTSRRSHDRAEGAAPLHLVSAFATTSRLVLGQEAVPDKSGEGAAIPVLLARLAEKDGLRGALVSIDAIATNGTVASAITAAGADYLLAVKANQPTLRAEVEACFAAAPPGTVLTHTEHDKGHGRIEQRTTSVLREVDWLHGDRRFPGELRLPGVACIVRVEARIQRGGTLHTETRCYVSSANLDPERAGQAVRGHWGIENSLHWVLDVTFGEDQSRLRKGFGAKNMAIVRHFALNLVRSARDKNPIKLRRKLAGWTPDYLNQLLNATRQRETWIRGPGNVLMVLDLDRLGRLAGELIRLVDGLEAQGVGFRSLNASLDTTTPMGRAFLQIQGSVRRDGAQRHPPAGRGGRCRRPCPWSQGRPSAADDAQAAAPRLAPNGGQGAQCPLELPRTGRRARQHALPLPARRRDVEGARAEAARRHGRRRGRRPSSCDGLTCRPRTP